MKPRLVPRSLTGQMLLAVALALLLAQLVGALLVYRAQAERRETALVHNAAFRLIVSVRGQRQGGGEHRRDADDKRGMRVELSPVSPQRAGEVRNASAEDELRQVLDDQDVAVTDVVVVQRQIHDDAISLQRLERRAESFREHDGDRRDMEENEVMLAGLRRDGEAQWRIARVFIPPGERMMLVTVAGQTLLIYLVLVGAIAFILRRITRPIAALTDRLETFALRPSPAGQLAPEGPDDIRELINAHNTMEGRICSLLD